MTSTLTYRVVLIGLALVLSGCASLVSNIAQDFADSLSGAILNSDDLAMVRDGAPAYLILIDSLLADNPDDATLLMQSAALNSAYAGAFVEDEARAKRLNDKAKAQSLQAACLSLNDACGLDERPYKEFAAWVEDRQAKDVPILYGLGSNWAGWIQVNSDDFAAIAELARVKDLMQKVAELDGGYEQGQVYLYLGVLETLFPRAMGGRPEEGRAHFEEAIARSYGKNLMAKVFYAEQYARLVFDQDLHDRLLNEVLAADPREPGLTLSNTLAQEQAQELLDTSNDYF